MYVCVCVCVYVCLYVCVCVCVCVYNGKIHKFDLAICHHNFILRGRKVVWV